jgi:hypothetical protein
MDLIKDIDPTVYEANYCEWILKYAPFIDENQLNEKLKNSQKNSQNDYQLEKTDLKWIEISSLQSLIQDTIKKGSYNLKHGLKFSDNIYLRKHFVKMMVAAEKNGILEKIKNDL